MNIAAAIIAAALAIALTALDLDRTFYVPKDSSQRSRLWSWWWGFCALNGAIAAALYLGVKDANPFDSWNPLLLGLTCGLAYLAILRLKFATFRLGEQDIPFGVEAFYDAIRSAVFRRINSIAQEARYRELSELSNSTSLTDLARRAYSSIENDALTTEEQKEESRSWLAKILVDSVNSDFKKDAIAAFLLSGRRGTPANLDLPKSD